jgi:hypothetical protein
MSAVVAEADQPVNPSPGQKSEVISLECGGKRYSVRHRFHEVKKSGHDKAWPSRVYAVALEKALWGGTADRRPATTERGPPEGALQHGRDARL